MIVFLVNGTSTSTHSIFFEFPSGPTPPFTFVSSDKPANSKIISEVISNEFVSASDNCILMSFTHTFQGLAGYVERSIYLKDRNDLRSFSMTLKYHAVGIVLFDPISDTEIRRYTGTNAEPLVLKKLPENDHYGLTVNATVHGGPGHLTPLHPGLDRKNIQFSFPNASEDPALAWSKELCDVRTKDALSADCSMAFSLNFTSFTLQLVRPVPLDTPVNVRFEWPGISEYERLHSEAGVTSPDSTELLTSNVITSIRVQGDTRSQRVQGPTDATAMSAWKIAIIVLTSLLVVLAFAILLSCFLCTRAPPPGKDGEEGGLKKGGDGKRRFSLSDMFYSQATIFDEELAEGDASQSAPAPAHTGGAGNVSEVAEDGSGAPAVDLVPLDGHASDKSVERLVLPREISRGVELESSTEGGSTVKQPVPEVAGKQKNNPQAVGGAEYKGVESSVQRGTEILGRGVARCDVREMWRRAGRRETMSEEEEDLDEGLSDTQGTVDVRFENDKPSGGGGGQDARDRSAVGAAISRIRQMDLLHGPASRGLVGRNGEALEPSDSGGEGKRNGLRQSGTGTGGEKKELSPSVSIIS